MSRCVKRPTAMYRVQRLPWRFFDGFKQRPLTRTPRAGLSTVNVVSAASESRYLIVVPVGFLPDTRNFLGLSLRPEIFGGVYTGAGSVAGLNVRASPLLVPSGPTPTSR